MESAHLVKVFAILEATAGRPEGVSLNELAALVGLPKSTAHRLLKTLCTLGYTANCGSGTYRQTGMVKRLALAANDPYWVSVADPVMRKLNKETGETINLGILRFEKIFYLHVIETTKTLRRAVSPQMSDPCFSTSLGRAIVSFLPEARQEFLLRHATIERRTPKTVIDEAEIRKILKQVKKDGFAIEEDETDIGVTCIGVPVFDSEGIAAAISLSVPTVRIQDDNIQAKWVPQLLAGAQSISKSLQTQQKEAD
ncbi:IclR family transcriptional regulator [Allorhodopirellula solitaria]|uniref:Transcriptional regulator KdgR n=1 Tax=Allorhodopirellula solitaria TaxID=2527987 RepID=A0A5C5XQ66_9BACT|nr:IclR family transcriptional regulator [Allorhodopirellula solitaria]TWT65327.1 Transcriptional regulator KdgR [Allorhodopirellula solitaria]